MAEKLTYKFIFSEFKKIGYTLLSTKYIHSHLKLEYICDNNHHSSISWTNFQSGYRCKYCSYSNRSIKNKHTLNFVKILFEKENYTLLTTEYHNNKQQLEYICDKGHKNTINFNMFSRGRRCKQCYLTNNKGENSSHYKGGITKNNLPLYTTYAHQIDFCEEVRRDPENNDLLQVKCIKCNIWFTPKKSMVDHRISAIKNIYLGEHRFYCSEKCKNTCSIYGRTLYPKDFKADRSREVQPELAAMVLERDSYECQRCGNKADLECHHYEGIEQNPIESADIDMCITLCEVCHNLAHKDVGCRYVDLTKNSLCHKKVLL